MSEKNVRPRIREEVAFSATEVKEKLIHATKEYENQLLISCVGNHVNINIHPQIHHFWSPQASINIEEIEKGAIVRGIIGPKPNLWATFMVVYVFGIAAFFITAAIGYSYITMNKSGIMLYISPVFLLIILANYLVIITGKSLAKEQSLLIQKFISDSI